MKTAIIRLKVLKDPPAGISRLMRLGQAWPNAGCLVLLLLLVGLNSGIADSLFFRAQPDGQGGINYNWFSFSNWFQANNVGVLILANKIPVPGDSAFILSPVNAAANAITIASLVLEPGAAVSGGAFTAGQVAMAGPCSLTNSTLIVQAEMYLGGSCTMDTCAVTLDAGGFFFLHGPQTNNLVGKLTLTKTSIFNLGEIIVTNGSSVIGGSNLVNRGYITCNGDATIFGSGTFDNSGVVQCGQGLLQIGPFALWANSLGVGQYRTLATNSTIQFCSVAPGPSFPGNTTNLVTGPGTNTFPYGATVNGLLEVGATNPVTATLDTGLAILSSAAVSVTGSGVVRVVAVPGMPSTLVWRGGTISGVQVDIDAGGQFTMVGSADRYLSDATVNNSGTTTTMTQGTPFHLDNGAVFNNLAGGLFEAQNDAPIVGSGGGQRGLFNNLGTFRKSGISGDTAFTMDNGAPATQAPLFNNSGLLDAQAGSVGLGGGTNWGQFNVATGARLRFLYNTNVQAPGAWFSGPGQVNPDTGLGSTTVTLLETNVFIENFLLGNAMIDGPGNLTLSSNFTCSGGILQGAGAVAVGAAAACSITANLTLNRVMNNAGNATTVNGAAVVAGFGAAWNNQPGGVLNLQSSGVWDYTGNGGRPTFQNSGTISNIVGFSPALNWAFTNNGLVWIRSNQFNFNRGFTQTAGQCTVDAGGLLTVPGSFLALIEGGVLSGVGNVAANVANSGTIHPGNSPGILRIAGNFFTNFAGGTLAIDIGGTNAGAGYSQLLGVNSSTEAILGGQLAVSFVNGFVPAVGQSFPILAFPSVLHGTLFASITGLRPGNGLVLVPVYGPATFSLVVANDPVVGSASHAGGQFSFNFPTTSGLTNIVEYAGSLFPSSWQVLTNIVGNGTSWLVVDPTAAGAAQRFYRVRFL